MERLPHEELYVTRRTFFLGPSSSGSGPTDASKGARAASGAPKLSDVVNGLSLAPSMACDCARRCVTRCCSLSFSIFSSRTVFSLGTRAVTTQHVFDGDTPHGTGSGEGGREGRGKREKERERHAHGDVATRVRLRHGEEAPEVARVGEEVRAALDLEEHLAGRGPVAAHDVELVLALYARVREHLAPRADALVERGAELGPVARCARRRRRRRRARRVVEAKRKLAQVGRAGSQACAGGWRWTGGWAEVTHRS